MVLILIYHIYQEIKNEEAPEDMKPQVHLSSDTIDAINAMLTTASSSNDQATMIIKQEMQSVGGDYPVVSVKPNFHLSGLKTTPSSTNSKGQIANTTKTTAPNPQTIPSIGSIHPLTSTDRKKILRDAASKAYECNNVRQAALEFDIPRTTLNAYMKRQELLSIQKQGSQHQSPVFANSESSTTNQSETSLQGLIKVSGGNEDDPVDG